MLRYSKHSGPFFSNLLGFVYFRGSKNVNPFVEANPQVDVQSQAEKNLDWVDPC
jgi:hypothetical protein